MRCRSWAGVLVAKAVMRVPVDVGDAQLRVRMWALLADDDPDPFGPRAQVEQVDNARSMPETRTASTSSIPPACDATPDPAASTRTRGYNPVTSFTWKVLLDLARCGSRQVTFSLDRSALSFEQHDSAHSLS